MPRMAKNGLLTIAEAAREKGVSRQAIHAAIEAGRLSVVQVGSIAIRIEPKTLAKFQVNVNKRRSGRPARRYCTEADGGCGASITEVDIQARYCTNCKREL